VLETCGTELFFELIKLAKCYDFYDYIDIFRWPEIRKVWAINEHPDGTSAHECKRQTN